MIGVERPDPVRIGSRMVLPELTITDVIIPRVTVGSGGAEVPLEDFERLDCDADGLLLVEETSDFELEPLDEETMVPLFGRLAVPLDEIPVPSLEALDNTELPDFEREEEETTLPDDARVAVDDFDWLILDPTLVELDKTPVPMLEEREDETSVLPLDGLDDCTFVALDEERDEIAVPLDFTLDKERDDWTPDPTSDELDELLIPVDEL